MTMPEPDELHGLWLQVLRARAAFEVARRTTSTGGTRPGASARADLVSALTRYTDRLRADRIPVPYQLRDELRFLKVVDGYRRP
jgi:hypothetical protein